MTAQCHAGRDGECSWKSCPQLRDDEPHSTGRHCPIDVEYDDWADPNPAHLATRAAYLRTNPLWDTE